MKRNWFVTALVLTVRNAYLTTRIRVRQWGALPAKRGATVLITNHQYINEGEFVVDRLFARNPFTPLVIVNSRRTFETGFFAARLPWTARWTRRINATGLWESLGVFPVENHLFSRALLSLTENIRACHGDLALEDVLPAERVTQLGLTGKRLGDLWELDAFFKAQAFIKLAHLRDPYRREALDHLRATTASDVSRIVEAVRAGATFYVTPEGDFSRDGRMHPLRNGITEAVRPVAVTWLCAIAYDPFRGVRLGMLYRIVQPRDPDDLEASLASSRPITTSALVATAILARTEPFDANDLTIAVSAQLSALPSNAFVDPELRRNVAACVTEALDGMTRLGMLVPAGRGYALAERRIDARFEHIADVVTYQRNMLEETITACKRLARA